MSTPLHLSCPVIRAARPEDALAITDVHLTSNSELIHSVYRDSPGARKLLENQYRKYPQGVYVLSEGEDIIGVMKLHLPGVKMGKTVSILDLILNLGLFKGVRAVLLLSNWDEYKLSPGEAYIEFMRIKDEWQGSGGEQYLYERAKQLALQAGASYVTQYVGIRDYSSMARMEKQGFVSRRKIHSPIAKLYRETGTWRKYTYTVIDGPITVKEFIVEKVQTMKIRWNERQRESIAALRVSVVMSIIPIVGGSLAYERGYPQAAMGWLILLCFHISGGLLSYREIFIGKYLIGVSMISEAINMIGRAMNTTVWFDRGWLIPLALSNLWVLVTMLNTPSKNDLNSFEDTVLNTYAEKIHQAKMH
ncbi:MAG: GNAT family N-acetyltransferase [Candidatus Heimdallarchaeota archaeon]|nr:GNAT family N-acetyltransferase [Candidatus Heimdallarchaeota archaeon]